MGVAILTQATARGIRNKFGMEVSHNPRKVIGYVMGVAGGRGWA